MPTTIDSLQIQIESSSASAGKSIIELGDALGELKKNGSFTTAINNLNKLRDSLRLFNNIPSNASKILSLSNSLESLKTVGSVSGIGNSLSKLAGSLKSLNGITVDKGKIDSIADALGSLSAVKAGGINTMMNGLLKISKVTEDLHDGKINAFAERIEKLTDALGPLSSKMTTIQAGLKGINSSARSAGSGVKEMSGELDSASVNLSSFIYIVQEAVQWLQQAIQKFAEFTQAAVEWDGIAARFGRTFGDQAEDVYGWIQQLNKEMGINVQQFMQYSSLYSQMLTGFGVATEDARNMAVGYTELTYDIWAAANDRYKTFEEAADAVASAIAGEVEPIRRAGFTIVESTLAETAAYHGLDISLANATEAQKSYLRYLTLVDQAHSTGTIGVYAKELNTAEGMVRTFSQQLKSLVQAFGSLFLPILVRVMPYLQAFVSLLEDGVHWIAGLFGIEIQKVDFSGYETGAGAIDSVGESANNATGSLNDATKAAKELKNATLGIDELNVISPPSAAGSGGAGAGGAGAGGSGFEGMDIDSLWDKTIFDDIQSDVDAIKEKLRGWMPVIAAIAAGFAGLRLAKLIIDIDEVAKKLKGIFTLTAATGAAGPAAAGFLASIKQFFAAAKQMEPEVGWLAALFPKLSGFLAGLPGMLSTAATALSAAAPYIAIAAAVVGGIVLAFVDYDFTEVGYTIGKKVGEAIRKFGGWVANVGKAVWEGIKIGFNWLKDALEIDDIWDVMAVLFIPGEWFRRLSPEITELFNKISGWVNEKIENLKGNINEFFGGFFDGLFDGLGIDMSWAEKIADFFDIEYLDIVEAVVNPQSIGKKIISGIVSGMGTNSVKDKLSSVWTTAKTWWDTKKPALKSYTPSIGSIYEKVKERWDNAREWWNNKKSSMKTYTPSIGSIYEKVSERWKNARDWWNNKKGSFKTYTPSIGSFVDKVKSAWNTAKNWWNKNVGGLSTKLNISVPKITVNWGEVTALGKTFRYPKSFSLKFAAEGGVFGQGSLVWAGERGPEVLANAGGGRTGVMNIQQMQEAVYEGVYSAVVAAMGATRGEGGSQAVNVYLDGRQITSAVEQRQRERGASLMGREVYA